MCGIYCLYCHRTSDGESDGKRVEFDDYKDEYSTIQVRGPDNTVCKELIPNKLLFVFHRLAIMDRSHAGDQPMQHPKNDKIWLMCNGEIYNHRNLEQQNQFPVVSSSDCEVILWMYEKYGFEETLKQLDGVFAIVLYDGEKGKLYAGRDRFGVRSLYYGQNSEDGTIGFSSLMKGLTQSFKVVRQYPPSSFTCIDLNAHNDFLSSLKLSTRLYYTPHSIRVVVEDNDERYYQRIRYSIEAAVQKRMMSDREIGCLVSGGTDSSLIAALVNREYKRLFPGKKMKTFSIGMGHSTDLKMARKVAEHLGTDHYEVQVTEEEFCSAIKNVVYHVETYDTTTVRASIGNYLISKYISEHTDVKVVFNGDGADEVFGSYLYFAMAPSPEKFQRETIRLLEYICYFDVQRSDRSISSNGLEARTPFLDVEFVKAVVSIPPEVKMHSQERMEKYLLRKAFDEMDFLPSEVLWRRKEAFSDGVSDATRDTQTILREYLQRTVPQVWEPEGPVTKKYAHLPPRNKETECYRLLFDSMFSMCHDHSRVLPYYWMPKWCEGISDPSARELKNYHTKNM